MAPRRMRSTALPVAALGALAAVGLRSIPGPAYVVRGQWQGEAAGALKDVARGDFGPILQELEPQVDFPGAGYGRGGAALSVKDGRLVAGYTTKLDGDKRLSVRVDDEQAWNAVLAGDDASLRVRGWGADADSISWAASQSSQVPEIGDVKVDFNSDKEYNLTVSQPELASGAGYQVGAKVRATNDGATGRLAAAAALPGGARAYYTVENPVGVYDVGSSQHDARLAAPAFGGRAALRVAGDASAQSYQGSYQRRLRGGVADLRAALGGDGAVTYNASYARSLGSLVPAKTGMKVGVDNDGVFGQLSAQRALLGGVTAKYDASGRVGIAALASRKGDEEDAGALAGPDLSAGHALSLSGGVGFAELSQRTGGATNLRVGYGFEG